jgi:hypothetical protein
MGGREVIFRPNPLNEQLVISAVLAGGERSEEFRREAIRHPPDAFLAPEHAAIWKAVRDAHHRGLPPYPATLAQLSNGEVDVSYLTELMRAAPDVPDDATLRYALEQLAWDRQKHQVITGPVDAFLEAIGKNEGQERIRGLARQIAASFDGWGDRRHLHDPEELVREQIADVRQRMAGLASWPFGLEGLDYYEKVDGEPRKRRLTVAAAPSLVTLLTGYTGAGKSSLAARLCLGLARQGRRILYGAWEMRGGMTLEVLACMSLGWSRSGMHQPGTLDEEQIQTLESRMLAIQGKSAGAKHTGWVRFMKNPFGRLAGKESNERNLDLVNGYIADSGCDVFVADLWERCLVDDSPSEEKRALFRQQAMAEELDVHCVLLAQQRKDMAGKRPTGEGIKGSGAYAEIADNLFGIHRPYLWKECVDDKVEIDVLKQRQGRAPLSVEMDWDADRGIISGGRSIAYERPQAVAGGAGTNLIENKVKGQAGKKR